MDLSAYNVLLIDRGQPTEKAIWDGKKPRFMREIPAKLKFYEDIKAAFKVLQQTELTYLFFEFTMVDSQQEVARILVHSEESNALVQYEFGVYRDSQGDITFKKSKDKISIKTVEK